jgi:hypothetical protein
MAVNPFVCLNLDLVWSSLCGSSCNMIPGASITAFGKCKDHPMERLVAATLAKRNINIDSGGHWKDE